MICERQFLFEIAINNGKQLKIKYPLSLFSTSKTIFFIGLIQQTKGD